MSKCIGGIVHNSLGDLLAYSPGKSFGNRAERNIRLLLLLLLYSLLNLIPLSAETRFLWDGDVPLHEWTYPLSERPSTIDDSDGKRTYATPEPQTELTTWVFDEGTFVPSAKLVGDRRYSIISDYLGTPIEVYDEEGQRVWARELDIYGRTRSEVGESGVTPFLYQGQYLDQETGLAYNRFRYYSPETGAYISQDPIRLEAGLTNLYAYVHDSNSWIDTLGLSGMPKGGWNYNNMPKFDDYQLHHVILRSKANHPAIKAAGFDVDKPSNLIYLPKESGIHPTRSIHNGWNKGHADYNADITKQLDEIAEIGEANKWSKADYAAAIEDLRSDTRQGLRKGKINCH